MSADETLSLAFLLADDMFWWTLAAVSALGYGGYYLREVVKVFYIPAPHSSRELLANI